MLIYEFLLENSLRVNANPTVLSQFSLDNIEWNIIEINDGKVESKRNLQTDIEEADICFPIHVLDTVRAGYKRCIVMPNDTDVIVALLPFQGIHPGRPRPAVGESRSLQLNSFYPRFIKFEIKKGALKADSTKYLQSFGATERLDDSVAKEAEQYFCQDD